MKALSIYAWTITAISLFAAVVGFWLGTSIEAGLEAVWGEADQPLARADVNRLKETVGLTLDAYRWFSVLMGIFTFCWLIYAVEMRKILKGRSWKCNGS